MDKNLHHKVRSLFLDEFIVWYEDHFGKFDPTDPEHCERWAKTYANLWYESGMRDALECIKEQAERWEKEYGN